MPIEMRYARRKVFWPNFKEISESRDFKKLADEMDLVGSFKKLERKGFITKDQYGQQEISFDYGSFERYIKKLLESENIWEGRKIINSVSKSFFKHWKNGEHYKRNENIKYVVNHLSMMCLADPSFFWEMFPDGYIMQVVREPRSWYASMKNVFEVKDDDPIFMPYSIYLWIETSIRALVNSRFYKNKYLLIRYEDLVLHTEHTVRVLCNHLGIGLDDVLLSPTMGGSTWLGNSSFGPKKGIDAESLNKWKEVLTQSETSYIRNECGSLLHCLGYGEDISEVKSAKSNHISVPTLRAVFRLNVVDELTRIREESRRMSILTHLLFNDTIIRELGGRYSAKKKGLWAKIKSRLIG